MGMSLFPLIAELNGFLVASQTSYKHVSSQRGKRGKLILPDESAHLWLGPKTAAFIREQIAKILARKFCER
jgi:hypothetical protein